VRAAQRTKTTRRRNPEPPISDELLQAAWEDAESSANDNAYLTVIENGYRRGVGDGHPDFWSWTLSSIDDPTLGESYIEDKLATPATYRRNEWGEDREVTRAVRYRLSPSEKDYLERWWGNRVRDEYSRYRRETDERNKRWVYIDHYPNAPEGVSRDDIGHGEYAGYVVVPARDRANPSHGRIGTADVAVPVSMLSAADVTRLRKLAPKKPRARR
jgi:hypothetical protein